MKGYKAFEKGLICKGKQYKENTVFEEGKAEPCVCGMHFCKKPLDVLNYYPLVDASGNMSEFAEVEALEKCKTDNNVKFCTTKLKVGAKIGFPQLVQAAVNFEIEKHPVESRVTTISENDARIGSSGYGAKIGSSGDYAQIGSSGYGAQIGSSGYGAQIGSSGNYAKIGSGGQNSVVCCAGHGSVVKAKIGSWITLSEWKFDNEKGRAIPVCVKTVQVDGKTIKEDTFYKLENGEFVEVGQDA